jgi:hypothetical protein
MSVNSVLAGVLPSYGSLSGNNSRTAKSAAFAKELPEKTSSATADSTAKVGYGTPTDDSQFQSELEQALRANGPAAEASISGASGPPSGQTSAGITLYKRVSQIGNDEPSASELLRRWNSIIQSGQGADKQATVTSQAFSQNGATRFESGILDLTA